MEDVQKEEDRPSISQGSNVVETVRYECDKTGEREAKGRIRINGDQYFANVPVEVWTFSIGGYQVCQKWLKDRLGRKLGDDEIMEYRQIIEILRETIQIMRQIDGVIEQYSGFPF